MMVERTSVTHAWLNYMTGGIHLRVKVNGKGAEIGSPSSSPEIVLSTFPPPTKMSFSFSHPVNTALLLYILYLLQRIILPSASVPRTPPTEFKGGYSWMPRTHAPSVLFTTYTSRSLAKFSGVDGRRILLAIAGTVFDVTAGRGFYGPGERSLFSSISTTAESD
jgi:hypothetical protein